MPRRDTTTSLSRAVAGRVPTPMPDRITPEFTISTFYVEIST
jgi:hypothetical protein